MPERARSPFAVDAEHRYWKQEHDAWRTDIALWQEEYDAMQAALKQFELAVQRHGESLQDHGAAIRNHEAELDLQERAIAEHEFAGERPALEVAEVDRLQQDRVAHFERRQTHERMKREHHRLVAQLEMLDNILSQ